MMTNTEREAEAKDRLLGAIASGVRAALSRLAYQCEAGSDARNEMLQYAESITLSWQAWIDLHRSK